MYGLEHRFTVLPNFGKELNVVKPEINRKKFTYFLNFIVFIMFHERGLCNLIAIYLTMWLYQLDYFVERDFRK